jgi:predicted CXXCH cytochrome family protein
MSLAILALSALSGCVDEKIVYRDRDLFEDPLAAAGDFLGYSDVADTLTVCGNCHVSPQGEWQGTAHAGAWETLQESGHAATYCEGCHTVNELGNAVTETAGYNATGEERYHDVQCESCHGPGLEHVTDPKGSTIPLAPMTVGVDNTQGCGECHNGDHHPFVEQWETSAHAVSSGDSHDVSCQQCHTGNGALVAWGFDAPYLEQGETFDITCAVCHDPHSDKHDKQLRFPVGGVPIEQNICSQCHDRRTEPDSTSSHGLEPHSPETGLLQGDVGWFPPGLEIDRGEIIASHGSEGNEKLCATCHVARFDVTDEQTGDFVFTAVGHGFNAIPCTDASGVPNNEDCEMTTDARSFVGCVGSGCHANETAAFSALSSKTNSLAFWVDEVRTRLETVDPNLDGAGGEIDAEDGIFTVAEGAFFNMHLAEFGGTGRPSAALAYASAAAHNPFLTEQLLVASVEALQDEYGIAMSADLKQRARTVIPAWR